MVWACALAALGLFFAWRGLRRDYQSPLAFTAIALVEVARLGGLLVLSCPGILPPSLTIAAAASPPSSLEFLIGGFGMLVPVTIACSACAFWGDAPAPCPRAGGRPVSRGAFIPDDPDRLPLPVRVLLALGAGIAILVLALCYAIAAILASLLRPGDDADLSRWAALGLGALAVAEAAARQKTIDAADGLDELIAFGAVQLAADRIADALDEVAWADGRLRR